jgi:hypothetical protein
VNCRVVAVIGIVVVVVADPSPVVCCFDDQVLAIFSPVAVAAAAAPCPAGQPRQVKSTVYWPASGTVKLSRQILLLLLL